VTTLFGREPNVSFASLSFRDGLPQGDVCGSVRDRDGWQWIAGTGGLCYFDKYKVTQVGRERATAILIDSRDYLWLGTESGGLACYDYASRQVLAVIDDLGNESSRLSHRSITAIAEDSLGDLWVGTRSGLNRIRIHGKKSAGSPSYTVAHYRADAADPAGLIEGNITTVFVDSDGILWVGMSGGALARFERESNAFVTVWTAPAGVSAICRGDDLNLLVGTSGAGLFKFGKAESLPYSLSDGLANLDVEAVAMTANAQMWVGTSDGLFRLNDEKGRFSAYYHEEGNPYSLANNHIRSLTEDENGVLWVGTRNGLSRFDTTRFWFEVFRHRPGDADGLTNGSVWAFADLPSNQIAIGTEGGVHILDATGKLETLPAVSPGPAGNFVTTMYVDRSGTLWAGTRGGSLGKFDAKRGSFNTYRHEFGNLASLPRGAVSALLEDSKGRFWVGTDGGWLASFDRSLGTFNRIASDSNTTGTSVTDIAEDQHGRLWVGTVGNGLFRFDPLTGGMASWGTKENGLGRETVTVIHETKQGILWVGTEGSGAFRFDPLSRAASRIHTGNSALPHDNVYGILEDEMANLWLSTGKGIAMLVQSEQVLRVFDEADGLQSLAFHPKAFLKSRSGSLLFGGPSGFNMIDPTKLPPASEPRIPVLTEFEMFGERVIPGDGAILDKPIGRTELLRIPYDVRNRFAFQFATHDYGNPNYSRFRYRLVGFDNGWHDVGRERRAPYVGVDPGRYKFEVQSSLDGNNWSSVTAEVYLEILPVWYHRWWAKWSIGAGGVSLVAMFLAWTLYFTPFRILRQKKEMELVKQRTESELSQQLQRAMLLEETAEGMRSQSSDMLDAALERIAEFFKVDRVHLHLYRHEPGEMERLELGAEHTRGFHVASVGELEFPEIELPFVQRALESDHVLVCPDVNGNIQLRPALSQLKSLGTRTIAAVRTSCGNEPNGIIFLHQCDKVRKWQKSEIEVLKAIAGQIGIAVEQLRLVQHEERYRAELEHAKQDAEHASLEAERARRTAEKANQAKSEFLSKMTHELRTPLNAILGFAELLRKDSETTEGQRDTLEIIHNSGEHLLSIINDVLEMSKIEAGGVEISNEQFDLLAMLKSVHEMLEFKAEQKGLQLLFKRSGVVPQHINGDKGKLRQVIINLLSNSLKFTDEGSISLKVRGESQADGTMQIHFEVADTGRGISEDELPKLFGKFVQTETGKTSSEGTGLGLAISRSFIQYMGGNVTVTSEVGVGTKFNFYITVQVCEPKDVVPARREIRQVASLAEGERPRRILIVDDQMVNRMLLVRILKPVGFELCEAENGREALEKWVEFAPELILMDQDMPEMNGMDATRTIMERADHPPVIVALTAYAIEETRQEIISAGCKDFLSKPFKNDELFELLGRHLNVQFTYKEPAGRAPAVAN
jgi:signal transduction histidine kinase/ligand-binding sensor domain-containing protein/ActR/RegA family two-component response regulator